MQTPFHPPPHLQRGEKRKNMENTKAFPKEFTPRFIIRYYSPCSIAQYLFTLYQNVLKINNITQKKDSSKEKTGFNIYLMHKKYCKTTSIYEGIHQTKYQHTI